MEVVAMNNTNNLCLKLACRLRSFGGERERRYRNLEKGLHRQREGASRCHQDAPSAHVEARGELKGLFAIAADTAEEDRDGEG
jgi:hypothetical protein